MVVPTLAAPSPNENPVTADAGLDQTVQDKAKPGVEEVVLNGSQSSGNIVSYEWFDENGQQIATGMIATANLEVGPHTITLRVTDDQYPSEDEVKIEVIGKNGVKPPDTGTTGNEPPTAMGVHSIDWTAKKNLDITVNIRRDSNGDVKLDGGDEPVSEARVTLTYDLNNDGEFDALESGNIGIFEGDTDASGNFKVKLIKVPAGLYQAEIEALTRIPHFWDKKLDNGNPSEPFTM